MTSKEWLHIVERNLQSLTWIVDRYHPVNHTGPSDMKITAPDAEADAQEIREQIRSEPPKEINVPTLFRNRDVFGLYDVFQSTWFGVPESTECWKLRGFGTLVDLLNDPPELELIQ